MRGTPTVHCQLVDSHASVRLAQVCTGACDARFPRRGYWWLRLALNAGASDARFARRGHWWGRLALNTEHTGQPGRALEVTEAALADPWLRGGARLELQRRWLRLGKPPRRWRRPPWAAAAAWEPATVVIEAAPVTSGVGQGVGVRNKCASPVIM